MLEYTQNIFTQHLCVMYFDACLEYHYHANVKLSSDQWQFDSAVQPSI